MTDRPIQTMENQGFSVVELLLVVAVVAVIAGFAVYGLAGKELYNADDQAYVILDYLKEARQRAITQREVMRVEINKDTAIIRLINENGSDSANDDVEIRKTSFSPVKGVMFDRAPSNIASVPSAVTPVPALIFKASVHPSSTPDIVGTLRFMPDGLVLDAGSNALGANASVTGATIYLWTPVKDANGAPTEDGQVIRAITLLGSSGNTDYLICEVKGSSCPAWR